MAVLTSVIFSNLFFTKTDHFSFLALYANSMSTSKPAAVWWASLSVPLKHLPHHFGARVGFKNLARRKGTHWNRFLTSIYDLDTYIRKATNLKLQNHAM